MSKKSLKDVVPVKNEEGKYLCLTDGSPLVATPEEKVRQEFIAILINEYDYPVNVIRREVPIYHGNKVLKDRLNRPVRADITVYLDKVAAAQRDQGRIKFVVECKAATEESGYEQLVSYIFSTNAPGGVWTNGIDGPKADTKFFRVDREHSELRQVPEIPRNDEKWGALGRRRKDELDKPHDIRRLFQLCHSKLYGRGMENYDYDLTMDMVRILLAKIQDESAPGDFPDFYVTLEEYESISGRRDAAGRVRKLFEDFAEKNREVFPDGEKIEVPDDAIVEVVTVLQPWSLIVGYEDADDWDVMGAAYEQYTHRNLKSQRGQFFTNRLIVSAMVRIVNPQIGEKILDPAGGSGGFVTAAFRHVRRTILETTQPAKPQRERQLAEAKNDIFLAEISPRLVKLAKTAMLLNGDGHAGMTQGNSLGKYEDLDPWLLSRCSRGEPKVILTNPPFAGQGDSRITDPKILSGFETAKRFQVTDDKAIVSDVLMPQQSPELLFLERCLDWLAPGGRMAIVLPKSVLDTTQSLFARKYLFQKSFLDAVITLHKDSFQPDTGVRTCVLVVTKKTEAEEKLPDPEYDIYMATSKKVGQDSEGVPIFKVAADGSVSDEIDHDLDEIVEDFWESKRGALEESQYRYAVKRSEINRRLNINPQYYSPHLNESIEKVREFDELEGWSVQALGQTEKGIAIFKGPRLKTENVIVSSEEQGINVVGYYTPSAMLQEKRDSAKLVDLGKASPKQLQDFEVVTVHEGDILLTRSGTIGRLAYVTSMMAGRIVSDDMIRIRISDESLRAYVIAFLMSENAGSQMLINEYGSIQQHLEPNHVRDLLIPIPEDWNQTVEIIELGKSFIDSKEKTDRVMQKIREGGFDQSIDKTLSLVAKS